MNIISDTQAAYIAGIMDGEGHICLVRYERQKSTGGTSIFYNPRVGVTNTCLALLDYLKSITGLGAVKERSKKDSQSCMYKHCFLWSVNMSGIESLFIRINPFMKVKQVQADLILEYLATSRFANFRNQLTSEELMKRQIIFEELRELNKKGR